MQLDFPLAMQFGADLMLLSTSWLWLRGTDMWGRPQFMKFVRKFVVPVVILGHCNACFNTYRLLHSQPTPSQLSMHANRVCLRPIVAKIVVDPPAWILVTLMLLQLVAAWCTPAFRVPLVKSMMPVILPSVATHFICVYLLEYYRRESFLRIIFVHDRGSRTTTCK